MDCRLPAHVLSHLSTAGVDSPPAGAPHQWLMHRLSLKHPALAAGLTSFCCWKTRCCRPTRARLAGCWKGPAGRAGRAGQGAQSEKEKAGSSKVGCRAISTDLVVQGASCTLGSMHGKASDPAQRSKHAAQHDPAPMHPLPRPPVPPTRAGARRPATSCGSDGLSTICHWAGRRCWWPGALTEQQGQLHPAHDGQAQVRWLTLLCTLRATATR